MNTHNSDFKNVSVNQFFTFMQEKMQKQNEATNHAYEENNELNH